MKFLQGYILTLSSLIVIFSAIYNMIPSGVTKSTLRSVIGIVTALALISPFFGIDEDLLVFEFPESTQLVDYERAEEMERRTRRQIEIRLEEQIKELLGRECSVTVFLSAEGIIEGVDVENVTEYEKNLIAEKLGINKDRIKKL